VSEVVHVDDEPVGLMIEIIGETSDDPCGRRPECAEPKPLDICTSWVVTDVSVGGYGPGLKVDEFV